jgi:hypothetical protein
LDSVFGVGSNPVAPILFRKKPIGENVEGRSHCGDKSREASLPMGQLGLDHALAAVQFTPLGVDHGAFGLRNLLRAILV